MTFFLFYFSVDVIVLVMFCPGTRYIYHKSVIVSQELAMKICQQMGNAIYSIHNHYVVIFYPIVRYLSYNYILKKWDVCVMFI